MHAKMHNSSTFTCSSWFIKHQYNCKDGIFKVTYLSMKNSSRNQLHRCNVTPNHRPACSSISQQRCHPWAGHDSSKDKGQCRLTHSQGSQSAKPTPLGLLGHQQPVKPAQSEDQPLLTRSKTIPSQPCEEGKDNRGQSQTKDETRLKPTGQFRVVLGPNVAKTTQLQPKTRVLPQPQTHNERWLRYTVPNQGRRNHTSTVRIVRKTDSQ